MRIMALDVGEKTVGVAVSDELELTANPRAVLRRDGSEGARLARLVAEEDIGEVVVGLPVSMSGQHSEQTGRVTEFARALAEQLPVPVRTWDERLSTVQAERVLIAADVRRARRRQVIDQVAAALILENYLRYRALRPREATE